MYSHLYLDIETIPAQRPDVMAEIAATIKPPATLKKAESIAAWHETEAPAAINEAYRKTGLDGAYGQICVIGFAIDDRAPQAIWAADWMQSGVERELLEDFACALTDLIPLSAERAMCVVGHNVANFDLRFLVQRSIVNRVRPHRVMASAAQAKPWEAERCFDTMVQWSGVGRTVSLEKLCKALDIPTPKTDITGATVWDAVQAGRIAEVADYCKRDVIATRSVHRRLTFQEDVEAVEFEDIAV